MLVVVWCARHKTSMLAIDLAVDSLITVSLCSLCSLGSTRFFKVARATYKYVHFGV